MKRILIISGDPSGDIHAASLARAIKKQDPSINITSVGGTNLKMISEKFLEDLISNTVIGFWEPVKKIYYFKKLLGRIKKEIKNDKPDMVIPVDFYGFNIHVAKIAKKEGIPVFYFISPQVWASRKGRISKLRKNIDRMLSIFPFEKELYESCGIPVSYLGHPLTAKIPENFAAPSKDRVKLGLLPGSRRNEISRHLPVMLKSAEIIQKENPDLEVLIFATPNISSEFCKQLINGYSNSPLSVKIMRDENYEIRKTLNFCISSSGTATLENALLEIPMVVIYKTSFITYYLAKLLIKVKNIAMANILAGGEVVPELVQKDATPEKISRVINGWIKNPAGIDAVKSELKKIRSKLGETSAIEKGAKEIVDYLNSSSASKA